MTMTELKAELSQIRSLRTRDPEEAQERMEALKSRLKAYLEATALPEMWKRTMEQQIE